MKTRPPLADIKYVVTFTTMGWRSIRPWWCHQIETFSVLLAICAGNSPVIGEFPAQRPVTRSFDIFFDLRLNKRLSKQCWGWWFETPSRPLWRNCNCEAISTQRARNADTVSIPNHNSSYPPIPIKPNHNVVWCNTILHIPKQCRRKDIYKTDIKIVKDVPYLVPMIALRGICCRYY